MFRVVGGDPEIFVRRAKVQDSYQELRVHHPSLAFPLIYIHFR